MALSTAHSTALQIPKNYPCSGEGIFDARVFNPHAPSNRQPLSTCYKKKMRTSRNEPTNKEFEKSSMAPSCPLSCLSVEVSETLPQFATRGSPRCYPPNGTSPTAVLLPGSDVACPIPSHALQSRM